MRCGQPIDYDAPKDAPEAFNAGHIKSWADYPELRLEPSNLRQEHGECNRVAGKTETAPGIGATSEDW